MKSENCAKTDTRPPFKVPIISQKKAELAEEIEVKSKELEEFKSQKKEIKYHFPN